MSKRMYHPCHKLSVPSAKLFWCRHCMQMFEDAISRWRHSRTCKGNNTNIDKDLNGQVIQLYVKPDKVSYQQNNIPGQGIVKYKPHVKQDSAELKCMICERRFLSLDDIREHVKYPCRKLYRTTRSTRSKGLNSKPELDDIEDPTLIKIRRVELNAENPTVSSSGSGLSVLAEASKHIESLKTCNDSLSGIIDKQLQVNETNFEPGKVTLVLPSSEAREVIPDSSEKLTNSLGVNTTKVAEQVKTLEPLLIVFQEEDGQIVPLDQLDPNTVQKYIQDTADSAAVGQIIQVQLGVNSVRNYIKTSSGEVIPLQSIKTEAELQNNLSLRATSKEVEEAFVNTPHNPVILERNNPPPLQKYVQPKSPVILSTADTQTDASLLGSVTPGNKRVEAAPVTAELVTLQTPAAVLHTFEVPVQGFDYFGIKVVGLKDEAVLEETVEEQGFLLPNEEQNFL